MHSWERTGYSLERMIRSQERTPYSAGWINQPQERTVHSRARMNHSQERMIHSNQRTNRSAALMVDYEPAKRQLRPTEDYESMLVARCGLGPMEFMMRWYSLSRSSSGVVHST